MTPKNYESESTPQPYLDYATNEASFESFERHERQELTDDSLISAETLPETVSLISFKSFAEEYPDKFFPLVYQLRPEFQEIFLEYYLLEKSQSFIGKAHGFIQTRAWQNLRIIEQTLGAYILLGTNPTAEDIRPLVQAAGLESTEYGSLADMIVEYATSQSYKTVAQKFNAPAPAIRKIFRPAIAQLLADKNIKTVAIGAYLRNLTHQASLRGKGLSKRCKARTRRVQKQYFEAPPSDRSPIMSFGKTSRLGDTPWIMFEIRHDETHAITGYVQDQHELYEGLRKFAHKNFSKIPAQIFVPMTENGDLAYSYLFARSTSLHVTKALTRVRGVFQMASTYDESADASKALPIPHADVLAIMQKQPIPIPPELNVGDFVQILTGDAAQYCGTITKMDDDEHIVVEVDFPTGRKFVVKASSSCLNLLPNVPAEQRAFWGVKKL